MRYKVLHSHLYCTLMRFKKVFKNIDSFTANSAKVQSNFNLMTVNLVTNLDLVAISRGVLVLKFSTVFLSFLKVLRIC